MNIEKIQNVDETIIEKTNDPYKESDPRYNSVEVADVKIPNTSPTKNSSRFIPFLMEIKNSFQYPRYSKEVRMLQRRAGITPKAVARLTLKNEKTIDFEEYPTTLEVIKFKVCGFKYQVLRDDVEVNNKITLK
jgi:hypothetical protein